MFAESALPTLLVTSRADARTSESLPRDLQFKHSTSIGAKWCRDSASWPVLRFAEASLQKVASLGRGSVAAWWLSILIIAPLLGSFITEPAAMTTAALLLARQFHALKPSPRLAYGTLGLLFVNISVGGTLTHFAAPPVLMVAGPWRWNTAFMLTHFGWKAFVGILVATAMCYWVSVANSPRCRRHVRPYSAPATRMINLFLHGSRVFTSRSSPIQS